MIMEKRKKKFGPWLEERILGYGGFGTVVLWKNENTEELLALKRCRNPESMSPRQRNRWQQEVNIMKKLNHENVIKAVDVPAELVWPHEDMPALAMELCQGGDLRKELNKSENCCGLPEFQVRMIVHDIAAAVEYLQGLSKSIIHRDLKPENVVIQTTPESTVYKIIDLGYAKEMNQDSLCTSFVGTLQYLAPELFNERQYTMAVDYWSMGMVVFECITGCRPFLPTLAPVQCHKHLCDKKPEDIYIFHNEAQGVVYSTHLPPLTHLCRTLQLYFEKWLRMMLRYDPKERGGGQNEEGRHKCFVFLDNILSTDMVHILNASTNQMLTYPVTNDYTVDKVKTLIQEETNIPVGDQELILATGEIPDPGASISQYMWYGPSEEQWIIFMFPKNKEMSFSNNIHKPLPPFLKTITLQPNTLLDYQHQRKAWSEMVFFCQEQVTDVNRIVLSQRAYLLCLLRLNGPISSLKAQMLELHEKLSVMVQIFFKSHEDDVKFCKLYNLPDPLVSDMLSAWSVMREEVAQYLNISQVVSEIDEEMKVLEMRTSHLEHDPVNTSPTQIQKLVDDLINTKRDAEKIYGQLRQKSKEERTAVTDHHTANRRVTKCTTIKETALKELYSKLNRIIDCRRNLLNLQPRLIDCCSRIKEYIQRVGMYQRQRQGTVWELVARFVAQSSGRLPQLPQADKDKLAHINKLLNQSRDDPILDVAQNSLQRLENLLQNCEGDNTFQVSQNDWTFLEHVHF